MNAFQFATECPGCGNMTITFGDGRCETCGYRKSRDPRVPRRPQPRRWGSTIALIAFAFAIAVVMLILGKVPPRP